MITLLTCAAVILIIVAIGRLLTIHGLSAELRGEKQEWEVTESDNKLNSFLMLVFMIAFFVFCFWQVFEYGPKLLPKAASEHGEKIDWLFNFNMIIIGIVAVITNFLLFFFAFKYYKGESNKKATFFPDSHKLELVWTVVPGIALAVIVFLGITSWSNITSIASKDAIVIELYAKQFDWTARYAGKDNVLGKRNFKLITDTNPMGLDASDPNGKDDIVIRNEFHIPKGKSVSFKFGSRDVLHSTYMPHFRAQMNCVPGMTTVFHYIPTVTTSDMRKDPQVIKNMEEVNAALAQKGEEPVEFNYLLLCNKICGVSHYNMQMNIIVDEPAEYAAWLVKQKTNGQLASVGGVPESTVLAEKK